MEALTLEQWYVVCRSLHQAGYYMVDEETGEVAQNPVQQALRDKVAKMKENRG